MEVMPGGKGGRADTQTKASPLPEWGGVRASEWRGLTYTLKDSLPLLVEEQTEGPWQSPGEL